MSEINVSAIAWKHMEYQMMQRNAEKNRESPDWINWSGFSEKLKERTKDITDWVINRSEETKVQLRNVEKQREMDRVIENRRIAETTWVVKGTNVDVFA